MTRAGASSRSRASMAALSRTRVRAISSSISDGGLSPSYPAVSTIRPPFKSRDLPAGKGGLPIDRTPARQSGSVIDPAAQSRYLSELAHTGRPSSGKMVLGEHSVYRWKNKKREEG